MKCTEIKDNVVYHHIDDAGNVRYVGSGKETRANSKYANSGRGKIYADFINNQNNLTVKIIARGLSKADSINLETQEYHKYASSGLLLNARRPNSVKQLPTRTELQKVLKIDETSKSGLKWNSNVGRKIKAESDAGSINNSTGYYIVKLFGKKYQAHRLVMVLAGYYLKEVAIVDHIDGCRTNNKLSNLRVCSTAENSKNRRHPQNKQKIVSSPDGVQHIIPMGVKRRKNSFIAFIKDAKIKLPNGSSKQVQHSFSISKLGFDEALSQAKIKRKELELLVK